MPPKRKAAAEPAPAGKRGKGKGAGKKAASCDPDAFAEALAPFLEIRRNVTSVSSSEREHTTRNPSLFFKDFVLKPFQIISRNNLIKLFLKIQGIQALA